ncbi:hypothetical protein CW304_11995 [Bacillus sp. UFRGS-B20]|nr:hypothetical protein CW304_11995 [Bacillus sp. UFRGS-B20]
MQHYEGITKKHCLPHQIRGQRSLQLRDYICKTKGAFQKEDHSKNISHRFQKVHSKEHSMLQKQNKIILYPKERAAKWSTVTEETGKTTKKSETESIEDSFRLFFMNGSRLRTLFNLIRG